jgi:uncharacterized membrane protein YheB (UPF0754 family)
MILRIEALMQRLQTLLEFHQKLTTENKDFKRMSEVANKIQQLTFQLEHHNTNRKVQTIY